MKNQKKVLVLMSGGVDSSVSALLLKQNGYDVTGVTIQLQRNNATDKKNIEDAKKIAEKLKIDHFVVDLSQVFEEKVIKSFVNEYISGNTPNPCVVCNKYIKFGKIFDLAEGKGFNYIATGHYANIEYNEKMGKYLLKKANSAKDQSYVLYNLSQKQLSKILFPISNIDKEETRKIAKENNLMVFDKPDSQDICFIKNGSHASFIEEYISKKTPTGHFVDIDGNRLCEHKGIINYTVGQRKGLGVGFGKPMYVISLNKDDNTVTLGSEEYLYSTELIANNLSFTMFDTLEKEMEITAKVRYKAKPERAKLIPIDKNTVKVNFYEKQRAITPGQSVVFYDGDIVIGGGVIN